MQGDLQTLLAGPAEQIAPRLLGSLLVREVQGRRLVGRIVETEAYDQSDAASHTYRGLTPRTEVMFGPAGFLYVYFTYGMYFCCNVVCGRAGEGSAVLLRGLEPLEGDDVMTENRGGRGGVNVANGPGKLCQALQIDKRLNGHDLQKAPLQLELQPTLTADKIIQTTRIGIRQAADVPWRFYIRDNAYVSRL
jgi:DNA-3-methyladenine glycosylase